MTHFDRRSVAVLGIPFDDVTIEEAIARMDGQIREGGFHQIATANVNFLMHALDDAELRRILCSCDMVVPDGMPVVWASRLMGSYLKERVSGVDLVPRLAALAAARDYGVFLLGASESSSRRAAELLEQRYPGLRIAGRYCPPLSTLDAMDHEEILFRIGQARPEILLVAMGNPKQEKWIAMHRDRLGVPLCVGVGGSLDFIAGTTSRAPEWMQNSGLEWLHRACQEPSRLACRYLQDAAGLAVHLPLQLAACALQPRRPIFSSFQAYDTGSVLVGILSGDVHESLLEEFQQFMNSAISEGRHVVLDLRQIARIGPDSLGSLIRQTEAMRRIERQFWIAGIPAHVRRIFRTAHLERFFALAPSVSDALYRVEKAEHLLPMELVVSSSVGPEAQNATSFQIEMLEDLCRRMTSVTESVELSFRGFRARSSAGR